MTSARESGFSFFPYWPALLLVGIGSSWLPLEPVLGYRWSVEIALALFLLGAVTIIIKTKDSLFASAGSNAEWRSFLFPLLLFVLWSLLSATWSNSWRAAVHHTLLWACYLLFYVIARHSVGKTIGTMVKVLAGIIFAISLACLVEYIGKDPVSTKLFNERYYLYAEIVITVLPLLVAFGIEAEGKRRDLVLLVSLTSWAAVLATTSRAMLISGVIGLSIFLGFNLFKKGRLANPRRWILLFAGFGVVVVVFLSPWRSSDGTMGLKRLSGSDEVSVTSAESRLLFWGLAIEGFKARPLIGLGADNYFSDYKKLRERYSAHDSNNSVIEITEELVPERAHNEYLQILSELGIVGAFLFGWILFGVARLFWLAYEKKVSPITIGALSGMAAFLIASGASSYSFRFPANGIAFFSLLAIASRELFGDSEEAKETPHGFDRLIPVCGIVVSLSMIVFSAVRATSIWHMTKAVKTRDARVRTAEIEKAISIDPSEPMFRFFHGQWLGQSEEYDSAISNMQIAIENGLADSISFFRLASTQVKARRSGDAENTYLESLRVYPRSIFLRTAFGAFLKRNGDVIGADAQYRHALEVDERQARSWQLAHDQGLERLVQTARVDDNYVSPFDLKPESATLALAKFQK